MSMNTEQFLLWIDEFYASMMKINNKLSNGSTLWMDSDRFFCYDLFEDVYLKLKWLNIAIAIATDNSDNIGSHAVFSSSLKLMLCSSW